MAVGESDDASPPGAASDGWFSLGTCGAELRLDNTLPTGQSFRWRKTTEGDYVGVVGERVVSMRQAPDDVLYRVHCRPRGEPPSADRDALANYFNLDVSLSTLSAGWAEADERFRRLEPHLPGCRMLRQDPAECLFSFICSSNNHISRIHGMVERLCAAYGTRLEPDARVAAMTRQPPANATPKKKKKKRKAEEDADVDALPGSPPGKRNADEDEVEDEDQRLTPPSSPAPAGEPLGAFYAFPTIAQLSEATEEQLRSMGFGYRAKFIAGSVAALSAAAPVSPDAYLASLRDEKTYAEAKAALASLPGVGPKVAACVCLFSLDKHAAIPVDTHVWQLAVEHYVPELRAKSLTPRVMDEVEAAVVKVFGAYAGWAHNTLFVAELAHVRAKLPEELRTPPRPKTIAVKKEKEGGTADEGEDGGGEAGGAAEGDEGGKGAEERSRSGPGSPGPGPGSPGPSPGPGRKKKPTSVNE
jgi:3-methyladenine DNA glycosylase/8-oxoguanine DNA glycosylase